MDDLLEEYFNADTSETRKAEIKGLLSEQSDNDGLIIQQLGDLIKAQEEVDDLRKRIQGLEKSKSRTMGLFLKIAASVMLIAVASVVLVRQYSSPSGMDIYEDYYSPYPAQVIRGETEDPFSSFFTLYSQGLYDEALTELENIDSSLKSDLIQLYIGNCLLNTNKTELAIETFEKIAPTSSYSGDAKWFAALSLFSIEQDDRAKVYLEELAIEDGIHQKISKQILSKIN